MDFKSILKPVIILTVYVLIASLGYIVLEGYTPLDALYMTVISITTVGYGEIEPLSGFGRLYTIGVIIVGFILVGYSVSVITEKFIEGIVTLDRRRNKMIRLISDLTDHYIICGYGRIGRIIVDELSKSKKDVVIIESNKEYYEELLRSENLFLIGDATDDELLIEAGVDKAKGLIATLPKDSDNLFVTLTAKQLNRNLFIIARANQETSEKKFLRAGADRVFSPYTIGAMRMTTAILKPNVLDFLDFTLQHKTSENDIIIEEITLHKDSILAGKTLAESGIRKNYNAIVVAVKNKKGEMNFNPPFNFVLSESDTLILIAEKNDFIKLEKDIKGEAE
jgi:voltage-gated potassium channel